MNSLAQIFFSICLSVVELYILNMSPCLETGVVSIFSQWMIFQFDRQKFLILINS